MILIFVAREFSTKKLMMGKKCKHGGGLLLEEGKKHDTQ